jgi:isopentenyl-diphosphate Delta-isomerase
MSRSDNSADDVILVDEHDRALGTMAKLAAHQRGLRHRAISVIVRDRDNRLLLQQRAATKYHSGGLWTNTCCSHPRPGEDTLEAARRRLREEMGVACELQLLFSTHYRADVSRGLIEDEIVHVFGGRFDGTRISPSLLARDGGIMRAEPDIVAMQRGRWPGQCTSRLLASIAIQGS